MIFVTSGPPVLETNLKNETVNEGSKVTFQCNATGNPSPTLSWTKDGNLINQSSNNIVFSQDSQTLTINNVQRNDAGFYVCNATNNVNYVSASGHLNVQCKYELAFNFIFNSIICKKRIYNGRQQKDRTLIEGKIHSIEQQFYFGFILAFVSKKQPSNYDRVILLIKHISLNKSF